MSEKKKKGLIHIYTGDGKGKTTASIGLAVRAFGRGFKVMILQFFKNSTTGEFITMDKHIPGLEYHRFNSQSKFSFKMNEEELALLKKETLEGFARVREILETGECDLLILDEIIYMLHHGFIGMDEFLTVIKNKPDHMEIVLTGRDAPVELVDMADLVTEMKKIKHPFDKGIPARTGIEN